MKSGAEPFGLATGLVVVAFALIVLPLHLSDLGTSTVFSLVRHVLHFMAVALDSNRARSGVFAILMLFIGGHCNSHFLGG